MLYNQMEQFENTFLNEIDFSPRSLRAGNYANREAFLVQ